VGGTRAGGGAKDEGETKDEGARKDVERVRNAAGKAAGGETAATVVRRRVWKGEGLGSKR